jgi:hypothetical protein
VRAAPRPPRLALAPRRAALGRRSPAARPPAPRPPSRAPTRSRSRRPRPFETPLAPYSSRAGCWEPLQGVALETDSDSYPVWRTREPVSLPSEQRVEFKLTLVDTDEFNLTPFVKGWEGIDGNRTLLPRGEELTVELVMHEQPGLAAASGSRRFLASSRSGGDVSGGGASAHSVGSAIDMGLMPPAAAPVAAVAGALPPLATSASAALLVNNSANNGDGGGGGNGGNGGGDFESAPVLRASVSHADGLSGSLLDPACQEAVLSASDAVMVVCYVLPVTITRLDVGAGGLAAVGPRWAIEWNQDSIVAKKHRSLTDQMRVVWVGCPHVCLTQELSPVERETLADALRAFHCVPVFVSEALHHASYAGFCRKHLWPTFHNHVSAYSRPEAAFSLAGWRAYTAVNKAFSDIVTEAYEPGDLIWVREGGRERGKGGGAGRGSAGRGRGLARAVSACALARLRARAPPPSLPLHSVCVCACLAPGLSSSLPP